MIDDKNSFTYQQLSTEQKVVVDNCKHLKNRVLLGGSKTGKTFLIQALIKLKAHTVALSLNGDKKHELKNIYNYFEITALNQNKYHVHQISQNKQAEIKKIKFMIFDDIQKIQPSLFEYLNKKIQYIKGNNKPFGGVPVLLVGDFCQQVKIKNKLTSSYHALKKLDQGKDFIFDTLVWSMLKLTPELLTNHSHLITFEQEQILRKIRLGVRLNEVIKYLNKKVEMPIFTSKLNKLTLCLSLRQINKLNHDEIEQIKTTAHSYKATIVGQYLMPPTSPQLTLKVGCRIVTLINDPEQGYERGMLGVVSQCTADTITVLLDQGETVLIKKHTWVRHKYDNYHVALSKKAVDTFTQLPVKLAYALKPDDIKQLNTDYYYNLNVTGCKTVCGGFYTLFSKVAHLNCFLFSRRVYRDDILCSPQAVDFTIKHAKQVMDRTTRE